MDENSTPEVVTEDEAIDKVKRWVDEMDWEKAQEGCKEILEIDPNNEDVKALLAKAEQGLAERPTNAVAPSEVVNKAASEVAKPAENIAEKPQTSVPPAATPPPQEPVQASAAAPQQAPQVPSAQPAPMPQRKNKSTVIIVSILGFLILALLIIALVFGWLNPVFDWVFGLIG